jgi:hypothetical protein
MIKQGKSIYMSMGITSPLSYDNTTTTTALLFLRGRVHCKSGETHIMMRLKTYAYKQHG